MQRNRLRTSIIFIGLSFTLVSTLHASSRNLLNKLCIRTHMGNVKPQTSLGKFLRLGSLAKTGFLKVDKAGGEVKITSGSLTKSLTTSFYEHELEPFFSEKKEIVEVQDADGKSYEETRVSFMKRKDDNYGFFFNKWFEGATCTYTAYQLKFKDDELSAFRAQRWRSCDPKSLQYILEVENVEEERTESDIDSANKFDERKDNWDF